VQGTVSAVRLVAVAFAVVAALILAIRAYVNAAALLQLGELEWATLIVCALAAVSSVAVALAMARDSAWALPAIALAIVLAAVVEVLPTGPPRLVSLLAVLIAGAAAVASARAHVAPGGVPGWQMLIGWAAFGLYVPVGLLYLVSGLAVPPYGMALLLAVWALLLIVLFRLLATRPAYALLIPAVAIALWVGILALGGALLSWTA
jgi:hypothetical protein